ncbi:hypothetical protein ACMD2_20497, partial [Ananas comosus]
NQITAMDNASNVVLDIDGPAQPPEICCSANPKAARALSRKGSNRMERRGGEEQETDDASKRLIVKVVPLQLELLKLPSMPNKAILAAQSAATSPILTDSGEGRSRRFSRFAAMHPRKILLIFATLYASSTLFLF